jgi:uncharacterized protein
MIGNLTISQCERILESQKIGRLGCYGHGRIYIVPILYVFHKGTIYAHSKEGLKISIMRKNASVCFQVDEIDDMTNWRSVIVWGKYEELKSSTSQNQAMRILRERFDPLVTSESTRRSSQAVHPPQVVEKDLKAIVFKISTEDVTGRFEKVDPFAEHFPLV